MLPKIPSENSGEADASRALRASERVGDAIARAPQDADGGEAARERRVDGVELSARGEHLARRVFGPESGRLAERAASGALPQPGRVADEMNERVRAERTGSVFERARERDRASSERVSAGQESDDAARAVQEERVREARGESQVARREVDPEVVRELRQLQRSDRQVRAQEGIRRQLGADLVKGGADYTFVQGPDGRRYAVGASTEFDLPDIGADPREAARDAARIRRAALASPSSSPEDQALAARAASLEAAARAEIPAQIREAERERDDASDQDSGPSRRAA